MKLNVIFVFRTINSIKLQGIHFYIIDIYVSGNEEVKNNLIRFRELFLEMVSPLDVALSMWARESEDTMALFCPGAVSSSRICSSDWS